MTTFGAPRYKLIDSAVAGEGTHVHDEGSASGPWLQTLVSFVVPTPPFAETWRANSRRRTLAVYGCAQLIWTLVVYGMLMPYHRDGLLMFAGSILAASAIQCHVGRCFWLLAAALGLCSVWTLGLTLLFANGVEMGAPKGALTVVVASAFAIIVWRMATTNATTKATTMSSTKKFAWLRWHGFVATFIWAVMMFEHDEVAVEGRRAAVQDPVVYRMWRNLSTFPVPGAMWEEAGFRVVDFDHDTAFKAVAAAGFGDLWEQMPKGDYSARSDLFRLLIIHARGGWYADADVWPLPGLAAVANNFDTVLFHEACGFSLMNRLKVKLGLSTVTHAPQWRFGLFAAPKGWPPLGSAVGIMRHRVRKNGNGKAWTGPAMTKAEHIDIVGPGVFTDGITENEPLPDAKRLPCNTQGTLFIHNGMGTWHPK